MRERYSASWLQCTHFLITTLAMSFFLVCYQMTPSTIRPQLPSLKDLERYLRYEGPLTLCLSSHQYLSPKEHPNLLARTCWCLSGIISRETEQNSVDKMLGWNRPHVSVGRDASLSPERTTRGEEEEDRRGRRRGEKPV